MVNAHPHGSAECILRFSSDGDVLVFDEPLRKLFEHPEVKNRQIVAFSTIGAFRKGKSFFLDYCLRFLYANYPSINYPNNPLIEKQAWMGRADQPLCGFSWRAGSARDTSGILMWSDAFLHTVPRTGEKLAIILLDTQGLFDNETSTVNNSRIFALGSLLSSIQILNLKEIVQEDQLQYLQFATEYAQFASKGDNSGSRAFQNLMFVIRDWMNPDEHRYGVEGGETYMRSFLSTRGGHSEDIKSVRDYIYSAFDELSCALLPHPGFVVSGAKGAYDGSWRTMELDFKQELEALIEHLLSPHRLAAKRAIGVAVKGSHYLALISEYLWIFKSRDLPKPQTILEATIERQMAFIVSDCFNKYIEHIVTLGDLITNIEHIYFIHEQNKSVAIASYRDARKMGGPQHAEKFQQILERQIEDFYREWSSVTGENVRRTREQMEKAQRALEEKEQLYREQLEAERKAVEQVLELEQQKFRMQQEEYERQRQEAEERAQFEEDRRRALQREAERTNEHNRRLLEQLNSRSQKQFVGLKAGKASMTGVENTYASGSFTGVDIGVAKLGLETDRSGAEFGLNVASVAKLGVAVDKHEKELFTGLNVAGQKVGPAVGFDKGVSAGVKLGPVGTVGAGVSLDSGVTAGVQLGPLGKVGFGVTDDKRDNIRVGFDLGPLGNVGLNFPKLKKCRRPPSSFE